MAAAPRPGLFGKKSTMRPPTARPGNPRTQSATPTLTGRISPAESIASSATAASRAQSPVAANGGNKRKERDFEQDTGEETNINVVVRCRGRNDRELKENSGVVVSTDGVKGRLVELSMGPNALSNKTYHFDKVFSPAADQAMVFEEVVAPILDEVISGFNCTIFAYGQTGTGKTYTMSGDITDTQPLPHAAGIIPRALCSLFEKLESGETENSVKCSFIELYNEELRDLLSPDDSAKLKLYEDTTRKGQTATLVQGMEEAHIRSASKGIELLRAGSNKRKVAATKCNDLSSRSHTVFTVTVYLKRTSDTGEEFLSAGKLNLVDLAGSENIQRSGAENKRAAEAGLINKSLLTLGRVINALVDRSSHIPYRESKLTRLLQDSLGGRTKTCIIATLSPAKSNLEETISTLDYAFRAKNIRNKPQVNQLVSKKTLLREFTTEIEKLKGELVATRQRNGIYLTQESYEEIITQSESRRILSEEQRDKIETMEVNLRNKIQELFSLTNNFNGLKRENEAVKMVLDGTKSILEKTEVVLAHTRQNLAEETMVRKAHQCTEENLLGIGNNLISTLNQTTSDLGGLHSKIRRKSDLHALNVNNWSSSQVQVSETTQLVEQRLRAFHNQHEQLLTAMSSRVQGFVQTELEKLSASQCFLQSNMDGLETNQAEIDVRALKTRDDMNEVLEEIKSLRDDVKRNVGEGLNGLSAAAERISAGVATELESFHTQLHSSYSSLGKDFKTTFDELLRHLNAQKNEADELRRDLSERTLGALLDNFHASMQLSAVLAEEKQQRAVERDELLSQISVLIKASGEAQELRLDSRVQGVKHEISENNQKIQTAQIKYDRSMDAWAKKEQALLDSVLKSREAVKVKVKQDWTTATEHTTAIQSTTRSVHSETIRIVDTQMAHMDSQLQALSDIVTRLRAQNSEQFTGHISSTQNLSTSVKQSYLGLGERFAATSDHIRVFGDDVTMRTAALEATLPELQQSTCQPLKELREDIVAAQLQEYMVTGETPPKTQYSYPTTLPRTEDHKLLLAKLRGEHIRSDNEDALKESEAAPVPWTGSPRKAEIFMDKQHEVPEDMARLPTTSTTSSDPEPPKPRPESRNGTGGALTEIAVNVINSDPVTVLSTDKGGMEGSMPPPLKRQNTADSKLPMKFRGVAAGGKGTRMTMAAMAEGRENAVPSDFGRSLGAGRRLRSDRSV